jgi:hydrogenase maturation protease
MAPTRILVAGIGNIFFGDDAFGCEVAAQLMRRPLPEGVHVVDFGIRSYDLAYAMMDDYDATILIDASPRGETPGTIYLIQPEMNIEPAKNKLDEGADEVVNAHSMNPVRALQLVRLLGGKPREVYVIGCEPAVLEREDGDMRLSAIVRAAVTPAVKLIEKLIADLRAGRLAKFSTGKNSCDQTSQPSETI